MHPHTNFFLAKSDILWLTYCDLITSNLGIVRHRGFHRKSISTTSQPPRTTTHRQIKF